MSPAGPVAAAQVTAERLRREVIGASVMDRARTCGDAIPWAELQDFRLRDGSSQRLLDAGGGGIWNPSDFLATLSVTTSPDGPYADRETDAGLLQYHYQKGPEGGKNLKMRTAWSLGLPLIRFDKVAPGYYHPSGSSGSGCTSPRSGRESCSLTSTSARYAGCVIPSCSTRRTSSRTRPSEAIPSSRTG